MQKETLGYKDIDYAVTGEAEESLPNLLKAITKKEDFSLVRGIAYKKDNGEVIVTPREAEVDVNQTRSQQDTSWTTKSTTPSFQSTKTSVYSLRLEGARTNASSVNKARKHSVLGHPKNVVDELEMCVNEFN